MQRDLGELARHRRLLGGRAGARLAALAADLPEASVTLTCELCREPDLDAALSRLREAVPEGGRVAFLEHVGRPGWAGRLQALGGAPFARLPWGCRVDRDVPAAVRRAGFVITEIERITMPTITPVLRHWVRGIATPRGRA